MQLRRVDVIGTAYINEFVMQDGSIVRANGTQKQHEAFSQKNARVPTKQGGTWLRSYTGHVYGTQSGELEEGCYAQLADDCYIVNVAGKHVAVVPVDAIDAEGNIDVSILKDIWQ